MILWKQIATAWIWTRYVEAILKPTQAWLQISQILSHPTKKGLETLYYHTKFSEEGQEYLVYIMSFNFFAKHIN